jgi:1,4-alpha-glucan branching enzyme
MLFGMVNTLSGCPIDAELIASLNAGTCGDPFAVLGRHKFGRSSWLTAMDQGADRLEAIIAGKAYPLDRVDGVVFSGKVPARGSYELRGHDAQGGQWTYQDAYAFGPVFSDLDEHLLGEGKHNFLWEVLGAHVIKLGRVPGTHFAVWAPNAQRVSVVGAFNGWDGRRHMMRRRGGSGVWEIFIPNLEVGTAYKYEIVAPDGTLLPQKADPVGFGAEHPPATASVVRDISTHQFQFTKCI